MEFLICTNKNTMSGYCFRKCAILPNLLGILLTFFISTSAFAALSHDQSLQWKTLNSKHFELHFHNDEDVLAEKAINIAEKKLQELQSTFNWIPEQKIEIILTDEFDSSNGFVIAPFLPSLRITLYPTVPDNASEFDDWLDLLITHELTHAIHIDKAQGAPLFLRKLFGRHPLSFPNLMQPSWILEGLATYQETDLERGTGRGQDDLFSMMMRMEVKKGIKSYEEVNMDTSNWPVGTTKYLYGVHFFQFLESQYSRASINRFIQQYSDNIVPFAVNSNSVLVYGKTMPELWIDFKEYLNKKYLPQLSQISLTELTESKQLTQNGYYKNFAQPLENGNLLYAQYDGKTRPSLLLQKPEINETEIIAEIQSEARFDYHPEAGVIISQMEIYRNTNYLYDLFKVNLNNDRQLQQITRGERYRRGIWNPDGDKIVALYNKNNKHTLALLNSDGRLIDLIWEGVYGEYIGDMDWSPDGDHLVASVKRGSGNWNIEEFSLENRTWKKLTSISENEVQPKYKDDGSSIFYSASYTHVYNIYEYHKESGEIDTISNVEGGAFKPTLDKNNHLYYIGYTANGYDIFKIENKEAIAKYTPNNIPKGKPVNKTNKNVESIVFEKSDYAALSHLKPTWWTPSFAFGEDIALIGGYFTGADALKTHSYDATLALDLEANAASAEFNYTYDRWFPLLQTHLSLINRKYSSQEIYHFELLAPLLQRDKKWYAGAAIRNENQKRFDELPPSEDTKDYLVGLGAIYDTRKTNIIANSPSEGRLVTFTAETSELFGGDYNGRMAIGKWQEYIAIKPEHVLAIRFITGIGLKEPRKFSLGGFFSDGNYYSVNPFSTTPFKSTLYNQRKYALRGYTESSLIGRRMMMYNLEWRFPVTRIEKSASSFPIGLHQISGSVFIESGTAWDAGIRPNDFHYSVGAEFKFHTTLFYYIPANIRSGYAYGMDKNGEHQFYLALGSSF